MKFDEKMALMREFGFSNREIKWIVKRSHILGVNVDDFLMELSYAFPKILKCHIVVLFVTVLYIVLDHENMGFGIFLSYVATWLIGCVCVKTQGPLIKSFKSYRMLKKIKNTKDNPAI